MLLDCSVTVRSRVVQKRNASGLIQSSTGEGNSSAARWRDMAASAAAKTPPPSSSTPTLYGHTPSALFFTVRSLKPQPLLPLRADTGYLWAKTMQKLLAPKLL